MKQFLNKAAAITGLFIFGMVVVGLAVSTASAQEKAYTIGPSDVITITIFAGGEQQHRSDLTVSEDGTVNAPFVGEIKAAGLTPSRLEKKLTTPLARDYFVDPKVNVSVKEYHSLRYYISGAVQKPGLYELTSSASLLELIAKAEGVAPERGNVAYVLRNASDKVIAGEDIKKIKNGAEPIRVDLKRLLDKGDMTANIMLEPGDVVYIPLAKSLNQAESKIFVEGEVKNPGAYDYQPGLTAMNACVMAGGFDRFAAPNRTTIVRLVDGKQEVIKIDLNDVKDGDIPDVELRPGDRIHVPESWL